MNKEDTSVFCMAAALENGAGFALYHQGCDNYREGFQSVPVDWRINTVGKWNYFFQVARLSGSALPERPDDAADAPALELSGITPGDKIDNISSLVIEAKAPRHFSEEYPLFLQRIEYFIDGHPVKYAGRGVKVPDFSAGMEPFGITGGDMCNGPFGFDIRSCPLGRHTLVAIPYYVDVWPNTGLHIAAFRDRTGKAAAIDFVI
jgi:hypothetical protein